MCTGGSGGKWSVPVSHIYAKIMLNLNTIVCCPVLTNFNWILQHTLESIVAEFEYNACVCLKHSCAVVPPWMLQQAVVVESSLSVAKKTNGGCSLELSNVVPSTCVLCNVFYVHKVLIRLAQT